MRMPWQQIYPGYYERPPDVLESLHFHAARVVSHLGKTQHTISTSLQLSTAPPAEDVRRAWIALRVKHPQLGALTDEAGTKVTYIVPSGEDLEEWLQESLTIYDTTDTRTADDVDANIQECRWLALYYFPSSRELLIRTPHWRADSIGLLLLQHDLLDILTHGPPSDTPVFDGSELARFPPTFTEGAGMPTEATPEMNKAVDESLAVMLVGSPPVTLREVRPGTVPETSQRAVTRFSQDLSRRVFAASKARGMTVTTTVQAAMAITILAHAAPVEGKSRLIFFNPVNTRDHLPEQWSGAAGAAGIYHTGRACSIDLGSSQTNKDNNFDRFADLLSAHYRQDIKTLFGYMVPYLQRLEQAFTVPYEVGLHNPGTARPDLSSLGILEKYLNPRYEGPNASFEIQDWWLGMQVMGRSLHTYLWTRDDMLHIGCSYNETFYERKFVEGFLEDWKTALVDGLLLT